MHGTGGKGGKNFGMSQKKLYFPYWKRFVEWGENIKKKKTINFSIISAKHGSTSPLAKSVYNFTYFM